MAQSTPVISSSKNCCQPVNKLNAGEQIKVIDSFGRKKFFLHDSQQALTVTIKSDTFEESYKQHIAAFAKLDEIGATDYINKLTNEALLILAVSLFYFRDDCSYPRIYGLALAKTTDKIDNDVLTAVCDSVSKRLSLIQVKKINSVHADQVQFQELLISSAFEAHKFINSPINYADTLQKAKSYLRKLKHGVQLTENSFMPIPGSAFSAASVTTDALTREINLDQQLFEKLLPDFTLPGAFVTSGCSSLVSTLQSFNRNSKLTVNHLLGLKKQQLLQAIIEQYKAGREITEIEKKLIIKFLGVRRGSLFGNIINSVFAQKTHSRKQFEQIIKEYTLDKYANKQIPDSRKTLNQSIVTPSTEASGQSLANLANAYIEANEQTVINIETTIKNMLKNKNYTQLANYIDYELSSEQRKYIPQMVFKIGKLRGGVLIHLLQIVKECQPINGMTTASTDKEETFQTVLQLLPRVIELYKVTDLVKNLLTKDYPSFYLYLKNYTVLDKYDLLHDMSHILLAIYSHPNLTQLERQSLLDYIAKEQEAGINGLFAISWTKRPRYTTAALFALFSFESANLKKGVSEFTADPTTTLLVAAGGIGRGARKLVDPLQQYYSYGPTTTSASLNEMLGSFASFEKLLADNNSPEGDLKEQNNTKIITPVSLTVEVIIENLNAMCEEKDFSHIISYLAGLDKQLVYCALSSLVDDSFIFNQLFILFPEGDYQSQLLEIWHECASINRKLNENEEKFANYSDSDDPANSLTAFRQLVASYQFNSATEALLGFYEVLAFINHEQDPMLRRKKYIEFAGVIYRAKYDLTSKWHELRLRSSSSRLTTSFITALSTGIMYGGVSTLIFLGILGGALVAIPSLFLLDYSCSLINAYSRNYTYHNSKDYEQSQAALKSFALTNEKDSDDKRSLPVVLEQRAKRMICEEIDAANKATKLAASQQKDINLALMQVFKDNEINTKFAEDNIYFQQLESCQNIVEDLLEKFNQIVSKMSNEATDKYTSSQIIFRLMRIIKLSNINTRNKIYLVLCFTFLFKEQLLTVSQTIARHRDLFSQKNFFLAEMATSFATSLTGLALAPGVSSLSLASIYVDLTSSTSGVILSILAAAKINHSFLPTDTYTKSMNFLQETLFTAFNQLSPHDSKYVELRNQIQLLTGVVLKQPVSIQDRDYYPSNEPKMIDLILNGGAFA